MKVFLKVEIGKFQEIELLSTGLIHNKVNDRYLAIAKSDLKTKAIIFQGLKPNTTIPPNLLWNLTALGQNTFIITPFLDHNISLTPSNDSNKLTLVNFDPNNKNQQWSLKADFMECDGNCSGNGICSYTTGKLNVNIFYLIWIR